MVRYHSSIPFIKEVIKLDNLYGRNFINMIKSVIPNAREASGSRELLARCPYCGDSKMQNHAHFYISVPQTQEDISFYQCKKCPAHGILNDDTLRKLGCDDTNVLVQVTRHNSEVLKLPKYKTLKKINIYPLNNKYIRNDPDNQLKLDYINKRIGANYTYEQILDLKLFLNLYDVLNSNRLELTRHKMVGDNLDKYFIGFISYDNSYCGMRKITDKELHKSVNKRYINYNLVNKVDDKKNYYIIPSKIDVMNPTPIRIHIAEGQFDILGIFHNLNNDNLFQNIYIACCGKSYIQALQFILIEFGIINYEIHFYPDRDVDDYYFDREVTSKIKLLPSNIIIHRNIYNSEKDFGVPKEKIKDSVRVIRETYV